MISTQPRPKVSLFSWTTSPVRAYEEGVGRELNLQEICAYAARVSNPGNQMNHQTSDRLLNYCMRKAHWSVFEMVDATMEVTTTRDISHQVVRHRSFTFQEFSQRYADPTKEGLWLGEARFQDKKNRQNSIKGVPEELQDEWKSRQEALNTLSLETYKWAVDNDVALECARKVLPEGNTPTTYFMKGNLRNWIHYFDVRFKPYESFELSKEAEAAEDDFKRIVEENGTQLEHKEIAEMCCKALCEQVPMLKSRYFQ